MTTLFLHPSLSRLRFITRCLTCTVLWVTMQVCSIPATSEAQGIVTVSFSNRGDWSIIGDNLSNSVVAFDLADDVVIEGLDGTQILRNIPGLAIETADSITIPKTALFMPRNVTIDLKQGDNSILMFYIPELITGSLNCRLGNGANVLGIMPNEEVEVLNGINIRGARSSQPHRVFVGNQNFITQRFVSSRRDISVDLKGSENVVWLMQTFCDRNLSIKTGGAYSQVQCVSVGAMGKTDFRSAPRMFSETALGFSYFAGKTSFSMGNGDNELELTGVTFDGEVVAKFGRGDDRLFVSNCNFNHVKGANFDGGRGENLYGEQFNVSVVPLIFKNYFIFP